MNFRLVGVLLVTCSCGPSLSGRPPGPRADELLFWKVGVTRSAAQGCGDAAELGELVRPPAVSHGHHLVFQVSEDATSANWLRCASREAYSCERQALDPVFAIEEGVLTYRRSIASLIENGEGCRLQLSEEWVLTDLGTRLDAVITRRHSLVDAPLACDTLEFDLRARSANGEGIDGCELSLAFSASLD